MIVLIHYIFFMRLDYNTVAFCTVLALSPLVVAQILLSQC